MSAEANRITPAGSSRISHAVGLARLAALLLLGTTAISSAIDANHNGMSDVWEKHFSLPPGSRPDDDPDGDGLTNLQESIAGTDPLNAADAFRARIELAQGIPYLKWPSVAGKVYTIQQSTDLATWTNCGASIQGTGAEISSQLPAATAGNISYRVSVQDQDSDGDGLTDWEEMILGTNPNLADTDGDGVSDGQEYLLGTDPLDYFNGVAPSIVVVNSAPDVFAPRTVSAIPATVQVLLGGNPASNAPVTFSLTLGDSQLSADQTNFTTSPVSLRTDANGNANVWIHSGNSFVLNSFQAAAGTASSPSLTFRPIGDYSDFFGYYEGDLEFHGISVTSPGIFGRLHSNTTAYVGSSAAGAVTLYANISAKSAIDIGFAPQDTVDTGTLYPFSTAPGVSAERLTASWVAAPAFNSTDPNPNNQGPRELIEVANFSYPDPIQNIRLANIAGLVIQFSSSTGGLPTVTVQGTAGGFTLPSVAASAITASMTKSTVQDFREAASVMVSSFDVQALLQATLNYFSTSGIGQFNGIIFIQDAAATSSHKTAIRFLHGATIPDLTNSSNPNGGLSLVTPNAVYLQGDFNCGTSPTSNTTASPPTAVDATANNMTGDNYFQTYGVGKGYHRRPVMIACDAFTLFSNAWSDANSSASLSSRVATNTTINLFVLTGNVPTTTQSVSGGFENVIRFAENWSGKKATFYGSVAVPFSSIYFTGMWAAASYAPPLRQWYYDPMFQMTPPPGLPTIRLDPAP